AEVEIADADRAVSATRERTTGNRDATLRDRERRIRQTRIPGLRRFLGDLDRTLQHLVRVDAGHDAARLDGDVGLFRNGPVLRPARAHSRRSARQRVDTAPPSI